MTLFAGADPGSSNYGYGVVEATIRRDLVHIDIIEAGMWQDVVTNLTDHAVKPPKSKRRKRDPTAMIAPLSEQMEAFAAEWETVFTTYEIEHITCERFQTRGIKGKTIEAVSMMNGALLMQAARHFITFDCITAATWKNQVNRYLRLEDLYRLGLTPHTVDSCFIGIHGALKYHNRKWDTVDWSSVVRALKAYQ